MNRFECVKETSEDKLGDILEIEGDIKEWVNKHFMYGRYDFYEIYKQI